MKLISLRLLALALLLQGCYSSSIMQVAKPLEKGKSELTIAAAGYASYELIPSAEIMYRRGVGPKSEIGATYALGLNGHVKLDYKYLLYHRENAWYISSGIGADLFVPNDFGGDNHMYGLMFPVYASFHRNPNVVPYCASRFSLGLNDILVFDYYNRSNPTEADKRYDHNMFWTIGGGIRFGKKRTKYFAELSYAHQMNHNYSTYFSSEDNELNVYKRYYDGHLFQFTLGITIGPKE